MKNICPYCGTRQAFTGAQPTCSNTTCGKTIPRKYLDNTRKRPPVWLVTVGNSRHGKTTYVDALALIMENLGKISKGTFSSYLDNDTLNKFREIRREAQEGILPDSTPVTRPSPMLITLPNFMGNPNNTLVMYDMAGEIFDDPEKVTHYADAIRHAETIWFLISIEDVRLDRDGRSIQELVQIYVDGMNSLGVDPKGRNIIVVYTKADQIGNKLPQLVSDYLINDPYASLADMTMNDARGNQFDEYRYRQELEQVSDELAEYTFAQVPGGAALINMIEYYQMNLKFCAVSAFPGGGNSGEPSGTKTLRLRVVDPLVWGLSLQGESLPAESEVALILDAATGYDPLYQNEVAQHFYDALRALNLNVKTYFTGRHEEMQRPDKPPKRTSLRTVGPILDKLGPTSYALVVTLGPILDLNDFQYSSWEHRLQIVSMGDFQMDWPHQTLYTGEANPDEIVEEFINLMPKDR
jgi:hypothetical protein